MASKRVVNFANLPIKLLMPSSFTNITEIAVKTIPSASKIEIKRVLESLYGFEVDKVSTLNMEGKKKKRGGILIAKPDYKKAYVTLKNPLSISPDLYPIRIIEQDKMNVLQESKKYKLKEKLKERSGVVEEAEVRSHWLDNKDSGSFKPEKSYGGDRRGGDRHGRRKGSGGAEAVKFPWSSMRSSR